MDLIKVFKDTRNKSLYKFSDSTSKIETTVYEYPMSLEGKHIESTPIINFKRNGVVSVSSEFSSADVSLGVLNFADALIPGGLVEYGAITQEEDICRCSNLYESLVCKECKVTYYEYNASLRNRVYSDRLIYSKNVFVFKDDIVYKDIEFPYYIDVVTCPAPSCPVEEHVLYNRIVGILKAFSHNGCDIVILGAWGCGAFGQDANVVGRLFAQAIKEHSYFRCVVFAITGNNYDKFRRAFEAEWNRGSSEV